MKNIKIDEFKNFKFLGNLHLANDEKNLFYTVSNMNLEKNSYEHRIYKMNLETKKSFMLTNGAKESSFIELFDGNLLFVSDRENKNEKEDITKFYKICPCGGEAFLDFTVPALVNDIKQISDNEFLLLANFNRQKELEKLEKELKDKEEKPKEKLYDDSKDYLVATEIPFWNNAVGFTNEDRNRLYYFNKETMELTALTDDITDVYSLELNDDFTKAVFVSNSYTGKMPLVSDVNILDISLKTFETIAKEMSFSYANFIDNKNVIAMATDMKEYGLNENNNIYLINTENKEIQKIVNDNFDMCMNNSVGSDVRLTSGKHTFVKNGFLYFTNTEVNSAYIYKIDKNGNIEKLNEKQGSIDCFDVNSKGIVYAVALKDNNLQEIYKIENLSENRISFHNDEKYTLSEVEELRFENDGIGFIGYVMKPVDFDPNKKYPGILHVHGGPKTVFGKVFHHEMQFFANNGYFVFFTNPRGSDGRGKMFADIRGKYGEIDFDDLMKFTDKVIENYPNVDENNLAIMGGSYGGFMTNWAIGHTNRFKAACSQRSIANMTTEFLLTDIGYYFIDDQISATPWSNYEKLWYHSPVRYANKVKTPTIFIHSDEDYRCWIPEGIQMFSALKYHDVPARLVMFKGENHELSRSGKPLHRIRRIKEIFDWFENYLK
ncbi:MAG: S9 family peptidase [Parvimonas sp.]|uniref:alpha/beta hydrolase family protein n=1 Tax=Parvimonas sp. TaxID=1944660 RepID=UPI0025E3388F|nr:S9 family peptidase [Parvimonas sp.]MCI5997309.1 S9 family peptidase [Parvimonas sp.]